MTAREPGPEERKALQHAAELHRPLAKAAARARSNGGGLLAFGLLSLVLGLLLSDAVTAALGALVTAVGAIEFRGAAALRRADPAAPLRLARGELVLGACIAVYCVLKLTVWASDSAALAAAVGDTGALGVDIEGMADSLNTMVYATLIAVAVLYQGGYARYYLARRADLAAYRDSTPEWAREIVEQLGS